MAQRAVRTRACHALRRSVVTRYFLIKSQAYAMHHAPSRLCRVSAYRSDVHAKCSGHNSVHRLNVCSNFVRAKASREVTL